MKICKFLLLLLVIAFADKSRGSEVHASELKSEVLVAITNLEQNGISKIDGQDLKQIKEKLQKINFQTVPFLMTSSESLGTYRASGHWSKVGNTIILAENHTRKMNPENRPYLILHEISGPLDINDENFNKSSASSLFNQLTKEKQKNAQILKGNSLQSLKNNIEKKSSGGSTGVDGGGDARILSYMNVLQTEMIFDLIDQKINESTYEAATDWINTLKLEFSLSMPQGHFIYQKETHTLIIPNNPMTEPNYKINTQALRNILIELYAHLQKP